MIVGRKYTLFVHDFLNISQPSNIITTTGWFKGYTKFLGNVCAVISPSRFSKAHESCIPVKGIQFVKQIKSVGYNIHEPLYCISDTDTLDRKIRYAISSITQWTPNEPCKISTDCHLIRL